MNLSDNPLAILTAIVAPAVLTNGCSVLSLGTANRIARVVDRTRVLTAARIGLPVEDREANSRHLDSLKTRGMLLMRALRLFYVALGGFAASALLALFGAVLAASDLQATFRVVAAAGLVAGSAAVAGLVMGCALMVQETRLAIHTMAEEIEQARSSGAPAQSL